MTLRFSARSVVLLLGVLWSFTGSAQTIGEIGTLVFLDIPEDAVVRVDGEIVQLEVDARRGQFLPYPAGRGIPVHVTTPDGARVSVVAGVDVGSITTIQFRDSEFRPPRAALALFAPGIPQLSFGRPVVGGLVLAGLAGAVGGTVWAGGQLQDARADADAAAARYTNATTEPAAIAAREAHAIAVDESITARNARAVFILAGVVVYALGSVDAFARHTTSADLTASEPRRAIVAFDPVQRGVLLRVRL
ncbi:MAG: hypothetical protein AAF170_00390 [Bacteroidota bacterium]